MDLLQKIREAVANLAALGRDELNALKADITKCYKALDTGSAPSVEIADALTELADIGEGVNARLAQIDADEQAANDAAQAARDRLAVLETPAEPVEGETVEDEPVVDETPVPIAAGGGPRSNPARMAANTPRPTPSPELNQTDKGRIKVLAASSLPGVSEGTEFTSKIDLARAMATKLSRMDRRSKFSPVLVASAEWFDAYGEERTLRGNEHDAAKLDAGAALFGMRSSKRQALTASGGVPLPTNIDYAMDTWAVADRPVRDGLDPYAVDRGGLLYRQPPELSALADATTIWTNANDIDPTDPTTKPVLQISAQDTTQVYISAVPTRLGFGNLMGQFDPETIAANTDLAIAAAARVAEVNLINTIAGFAVGVTKSQVMGASRDLFQTIIQAAAAYRFSYRLARDLPLSFLAPTWTLDIFKADRVWELAHDSAGSFDPFAISDDYITEALAKYDIYPIWSLDGLPANTSVTPNYVTQNFTAFTQNDAVPAFPTELVWHLFIKGSIQFLDGGRLDLGVVRDSTLDATNDYETFVETFENVANRGFSGGVIQGVSSLLPTGASSEGIEA